MVVFKAISLSDIDVITAMMREFYVIDNYPFNAETAKGLFRQFLTEENLGKAWLILNENEIVGYVILTFVFSFEYGGRMAFLDELYLSEKARGKGIGKETLKFIQTEALKLKLKVVYLEVEEHNANVQKLYLAHDFSVHHRKLMKYTVK